MHAVVVNVTIAPGQVEASRKGVREQVIPRVSKAPGFVKGYWTAAADAAQGMSFVLFHTAQDAANAVNMIRTAPPPPGVTLNAVDVREVIAEA
jgi:hypothetical protein